MESDASVDPTAPGGEAEPEYQPMIYVASLSDYNAGILHGEWIAADQSVEQLGAEIDTMLAASPTAKRFGEPAEEWRIDDAMGWDRIDLTGYESLQTVSHLAAGLVAHGDAFGAWVSLVGINDQEEIDQFEDRYVGEFSWLEDFGESLLEDMGFNLDNISGIPDVLRPYVTIDTAGWSRDMQLSGDIATAESNSGVHIFWAH